MGCLRVASRVCGNSAAVKHTSHRCEQHTEIGYPVLTSQELAEAVIRRRRTTPRRPVHVPPEAHAPPAAVFYAIAAIITMMHINCIAAAATIWARVYHDTITNVRTAPVLPRDATMV